MTYDLIFKRSHLLTVLLSMPQLHHTQVAATNIKQWNEMEKNKTTTHTLASLVESKAASILRDTIEQKATQKQNERIRRKKNAKRNHIRWTMRC